MSCPCCASDPTASSCFAVGILWTLYKYFEHSAVVCRIREFLKVMIERVTMFVMGMNGKMSKQETNYTKED